MSWAVAHHSSLKWVCENTLLFKPQSPLSRGSHPPRHSDMGGQCRGTDLWRLIFFILLGSESHVALDPNGATALWGVSAWD